MRVAVLLVRPGDVDALFQEDLRFLDFAQAVHIVTDHPDVVVAENALDEGRENVHDYQTDDVALVHTRNGEFVQRIHPVEQEHPIPLSQQRSCTYEVSDDGSTRGHQDDYDDHPRGDAVEVYLPLEEQRQRDQEERQPDHGNAEDLDQDDQNAQSQEDRDHQEVIEAALEFGDGARFALDQDSSHREREEQEGQERVEVVLYFVELLLLWGVLVLRRREANVEFPYENCQVEQRECYHCQRLYWVGHCHGL